MPKKVPKKRNDFTNNQATKIALSTKINKIIGVHVDRYQLEITVIEQEGIRYISLADVSKLIKLLNDDPSLIRAILPDVPPPPPK